MLRIASRWAGQRCGSSIVSGQALETSCEGCRAGVVGGAVLGGLLAVRGCGRFGLDPIDERFRAMEGEDAAATRLGVEQVRELGLLAGALVEHGEGEGPARDEGGKALGVVAGLGLDALERGADRFRFEDADGLAVRR